MSKILFSLFLSFCLLTSSCSVFKIGEPTGQVDLAKVVRYLEPASFFASDYILNKSVDAADKQDKAEIIFSISRTIRKLAEGEVPTPNDFEAAISKIVPSKSHWGYLISELSHVYTNFYSQTTEDERMALVFEALGEIAEGCERSSRLYVSDGFYDQYVDTSVTPFESYRTIQRPLALTVMRRSVEN